MYYHVHDYMKQNRHFIWDFVHFLKILDHLKNLLVMKAHTSVLSILVNL